MLLSIDVGNTNTVLGLFRKGQPIAKGPFKTWRASTHPSGTADEFRAKLHVFLSLDGLKLSEISAVAVSSVVPPFTGMLRGVFGETPLHLIDSHSPFSFANKASPPTQVGADRLVNAEAVVREYGAPAIVVDSGTATTVCAITRDRDYRGGAIMPGIELSIQSLAKNTAKLFSVELTAPTHVIGSNTTDALRSGILLGYASMIDGMVKRFKAELEEPHAKVVATGGVSALLKDLAVEITDFDPNLTMKGIAYVHEQLSHDHRK
jgi:type III pantothenate kinase